MEDNNEKMVNNEEMTTEIAESQKETANVENGEQLEKQDVSKEAPQEEKPKLTFDEKVDVTAGFIKKNKIALLCGIVAVLALVIGLFVGSFFGGNDETEETSSYQAEVSTDDGQEEDVVSTTSPTATAAATATPTTTVSPTTSPTTSSSGSTSEEVVSEPESGDAVVVTYADLLDSKVYFSTSANLSLVESDVIQLLNNVLLASDETVTAGGVEADFKETISDDVQVNVTKDEMKALLDDLGATFTNIDQSVSGDILTLDVDMNMDIPADVLSEVQSNSDSIITTLALSALSTNLSFSYQVSYEMDGESLVPISVTTSTIDINGLGTSITKLIASIALSSYSSADVDTSTLLAGYNSMAGEIIADVLNNYGIVTGATSSEINITTRTNE